jgi:hypothetical protein
MSGQVLLDRLASRPWQVTPEVSGGALTVATTHPWIGGTPGAVSDQQGNAEIDSTTGVACQSPRRCSPTTRTFMSGCTCTIPQHLRRAARSGRPMNTAVALDPVSKLTKQIAHAFIWTEGLTKAMVFIMPGAENGALTSVRAGPSPTAKSSPFTSACPKNGYKRARALTVLREVA